MSEFSFVLIHSPLVGTYTWQAVADYLREQGYDVFVPDLHDEASSEIPYWKQEITHLNLPSTEVVLIGHSGAGALLPAIGEKCRVQAYIFVDAVLLFQTASRLELMALENPEFAQTFGDFLRDGGKFPNWADEQLQMLIPDKTIRQKLLADLRPRALDFFTEHIEAAPDWNTKPCAYLQLSETYKYYASQSEAHNWIVAKRETHHFEMLTNPIGIAQLLIQVTEQLLG